MSVGAFFQDFFIKGSPLDPNKAITRDELRKGYKRIPGAAKYLPWLDIIDNNKILLDDGKSVAAVFDITPIPTEARSEEQILSIRNNIARFVADTFEEHSVSPWVVQTFSWCDESIFRQLPDHMLAHAIKVQSRRGAELHPYTEYFINDVYRDHVGDLARDGGLFIDQLNGRPWGGSTRQCYMVCYRRQEDLTKRRRNQSREIELDTQCTRVAEMMRSAGMQGRRLQGDDIWAWLFRWMNPRPKLAAGDRDAWLKSNPYPTPENRTAEWDLAADCVSRDVRRDEKNQYWYFDGMPHTIVSVERMLRVPEVGQLSAERYESRDEMAGPNARTQCFIDELPSGAIAMVTYVVRPQTEIKRHIDRLEKNAKGASTEAEMARDEINHARRQIARGNKLYPYSMAIALRADDEEAMDDALLMTDMLLGKNGLSAIDPDLDHFRLDRYIRFLPCAYDPKLDQVNLRQRIIYTHHLANLIPVYGRSTGTGNPCIVVSNRGGEAFMCDPLLQGDRAKNAHLFLFGPTGAGKSNTLCFLQMLITAMYFPRWVVVEAGNSFGLLSEHFRTRGLKVVDIVFRPGVAPSLAPFKPALELVDRHGRVIQSSSKVEDVLAGDAELEEADSGQDTDESIKRDILGEMLIIARLMVTGGEEKEEDRMTRADSGVLKNAILNAASEAKLAGKVDLLPEDVIRHLRAQVNEKPDSSRRINEMADAMELFTDGFAGELFNRPGEELPDADYIRIEMADLASGNDTNDKLSVAYIAIINQIIARAIRTQRDGRPTINLTDEAHVITTNPLLAKYLVVVSKLLGRRMGLWLWQATQNMEDYKDDAKKMLAMFEWWMCLKIDKGELVHIERVRELNDDQRSMMLSTRKQSGAYTEGVIMSDNVQGLFRIVPPALCFALAMTEKEERQERTKLMHQFNITEMEAAEMIGRNLAEKRRNMMRKQT